MAAELVGTVSVMASIEDFRGATKQVQTRRMSFWQG
jgi:hypothetical protein